MSKDEMKIPPGVGLDAGTMNLVSARQTASGGVAHRSVRNAFIDLDMEVKKMLKLKKVPYVDRDGRIIVMGDAALTMANLLSRELRRPLAKGLISTGELEAQSILALLISQILSDPVVEGEHCYYSVPASPIDVPDQDVVYHTEVLRKAIAQFGYTPHPWNEALAIIYSNCEDEEYSGLALSLGSGMANIALAVDTVMGLDFSLTRGGGDWIDTYAAKAVGSTSSKICAIKEAGVDLLKPKTREEEAIALYIETLIRNVLSKIVEQFKASGNKISVQKPIPFVVSGGTSRAGNFLTVFQREFDAIKKGFPIPISEIRLARDPMTSVADGLLILASQEDD